MSKFTDLDRNFDLEDVHVEGAERIAEAVAKYDVDRFIHVSSYNADVNSPSEFFKTKVGLFPELPAHLIDIIFLGTRRSRSSKHIPRDHNRETSTVVWIRRSSPPQARRCD